jgi:hypothetical protein
VSGCSGHWTKRRPPGELSKTIATSGPQLGLRSDGDGGDLAAFEIVRFSEAYDLASVVWSMAVEWSPPEEFDSYLDPWDDEVFQRLTKPHRDTLLHLFLRRFYARNYIEEFEENRNDMLDLVADEYEAVLRLNGVLFKQRPFPAEDDPAYEQKALRRIACLRARLPLSRIAQDTFQLLFRDRAFLLRFNQLASRAVARIPRAAAKHRVGRSSGGQRRVRTPTWLMRGVFYRDNGRCVACGKDLTGVLIAGNSVHYDHIVPLAKHGSNDPTNFQTLCGGCNLAKSVETHTSERYPVFWSSG